MRNGTAAPRDGQRDPRAGAKRLGIARELIAYGAHLIPCRPDKSPDVRGSWKDREASNAGALAAIRKGNPFGLVPGSVGLAVVDLDRPEGPKPGVNDWADAMDPAFWHPSGNPDNRHLWFDAPDRTVGNDKWERDGYAGEHRGTNGYVVLYRPREVLQYLVDRKRPGARPHPLPDLPKPGGKPKAVESPGTKPEPGPAPDHGRKAGKPPPADVAAAMLECIPADDYDDWVRVGMALKTAGVPFEVYDRWSARSGKYDGTPATREKWDSFTGSGVTMGTVRKLARDGGWRPDNLIEINAGGFQTALGYFGWRLRVNVLSGQQEWHVGDGWVPESRRLNRWMREQIRERFSTPGHGDKLKPAVFGRGGRWDDVTGYLMQENQVDPFGQYLESLPPWDGGKRLDFVLSDWFGAEDNALTRWGGAFLFLTAVKRWREPGAKVDEVLVLMGSAGCGKTAYVEGALPPELSEYAGKIDLSSQQKAMESVQGTIVCEIGEGRWLTKADREDLKDFISQRNDGVARGAYERGKHPQWRRCAIVATADHANPLPNDSNLRRWVVVKLAHGCNVEERYAEARDLLWAEAVARIDAGESPRLPRELLPAAEEIAKEHRSSDFALEEAITKVFARAQHTYMTASEVVTQVDNLMPGTIPNQRVYAAMKAMGYRPIKRRWIPGKGPFSGWTLP